MKKATRQIRHSLPPRWLALTGLAVLCAAGPARAQFTVSPGSLQLAATDSAAGAVVHVRNEGDRDLQFRYYLGDFEQAQSGDYEFRAFGTSASSCGKRLSVFPDGAVIAAGREDAVRVRMEPGAQGCWAMLFVETAAEGQGPMRIAKRVAVKVFAVPAAAGADGEVSAVAVKREAGEMRAHVLFRSTGLMPVNATGSLEIRSVEGKVLERVEIERFSVLPGHTRELVIPVKKTLPPGRYLAVPVIDFGADYMAGGQGIFTVPG